MLRVAPQFHTGTVTVALHHGPEILAVIRTADAEDVGVDSVEIVEHQRRIVSAAGHADRRPPTAAQPASAARISGLFAGGQRADSSIGGKGVSGLRSSAMLNGCARSGNRITPSASLRLQYVRLRVHQVALALLQLELGLDHVRPRHFAAPLLLLRDVEKRARFVQTAARIQPRAAEP